LTVFFITTSLSLVMFYGLEGSSSGLEIYPQTGPADILARNDRQDDLLFWWPAGELRRMYLGRANRTFLSE
jgi:hypothetical protein